MHLLCLKVYLYETLISFIKKKNRFKEERLCVELFLKYDESFD